MLTVLGDRPKSHRSGVRLSPHSAAPSSSPSTANGAGGGEGAYGSASGAKAADNFAPAVSGDRPIGGRCFGGMLAGSSSNVPKPNGVVLVVAPPSSSEAQPPPPPPGTGDDAT